MTITKEQIEHDWNYQLQQLKLYGDDEEFKHKTLNLLQAIYERAARLYGFAYAETLPKPKSPVEAI